MKTALRTALALSLALFIALAAAADGAWKTTDIGGIHYAVERSSLHPKQWEKALQHTPDCKDPCIVEFDDRMSAVYLRYKWAQLNPEKGVYDFSDLGQVLDKIHAAGKMATLQVMAGKYTPAWVFEDGAGHISTPARDGDAFSQPFVPRPWDPVFLEAHGNMISALANYLRETPDRYETVAMVKNGGIVVHSGETRLMPVKVFMKNAQKNDPAKKEETFISLCHDWARAGYSEAKILKAFDELNDQITTAFPDQYIGLAFVAGSRRFPTVDSSGNCSYPQKNNTMKTMIQKITSDYGKRVMINNTYLTEDEGRPPVMRWVKSHGGNIGFQVERVAFGCREDRNYGCDAGDLTKALQAGVDAGAVFIEVHDGNINNFKDILVEFNKILSQR